MVNAQKFEIVRNRMEGKKTPWLGYQMRHIWSVKKYFMEKKKENEIVTLITHNSEKPKHVGSVIECNEYIAGLMDGNSKAIRMETIARAIENAYAEKLEAACGKRDPDSAVLAIVDAVRFGGADGKEAAGRRLETIKKVAFRQIAISWENMFILSEFDRHLESMPGADRVNAVVNELCRLGNYDIRNGYTAWDATVAIAGRHGVTIDQIDVELRVRDAFSAVKAKKQ